MKKNNKKGFTLVELVIVVAVMAVLVAIAIPTVKSVVNSAKTAVSDSNANTIESMIKLYMAEKEVTVSADNIDKALTEAHLGIESGTYVYDDTTGSVKAGTAASNANQYLITFTASATTEADKITVVKGSGSSPSPSSGSDE